MLKFAYLLLLGLCFRGTFTQDFTKECSSDKESAEIGETLIITCHTTFQFEEDDVGVYKNQHHDSDPVLLAHLKTSGVELGPIFENSGKVTFDKEYLGRGSYTYHLTISDLQPSDSGMYGLEDDMEVLVVANSYLGELIMHRRRDDGGEFEVATDQEVLHIDKGDDEEEHWEFICTVDGGSVTPTLSLTYGDDDLTDQFDFKNEIVKQTAEGIDSDHFSYDTTKVTATSIGDIIIDKSHQRKYMTCTASLDGSDSKSVGVTFSFRSAPVIECTENVIAGRGKPVTLVCEVECDPDPAEEGIVWEFTNVYYEAVTLAANGVDELMNITTTQEIKNGKTIVLSLHIPIVYEYSFTSYKVSVTNDIGDASGEVTLIHDSAMDIEALVDDEENDGSKVSMSIMSSLILSLITYLLKRVF